jgi:hypothetical protein
MSIIITSAQTAAQLPNSDHQVLHIENLKTDVTLEDGRVVQNNAFTVQGAKHVTIDGQPGISIAIDLDLFVAFGDEYLTEAGQHRHAGNSLEYTNDGTISPELYARLERYADAAIENGWEFNGRRLQMATGVYYFNLLVGKKGAMCLFDLEEVEIENSDQIGGYTTRFVMTNFALSPEASLGISDSADAVKGKAIKFANPFTKAAAVSPKSVQVPVKLAK